MKSTQLAKATNALKDIETEIDSKRSSLTHQISKLNEEIGKALIHQKIGLESDDVEALRRALRQAYEEMSDLDLMEMGLPAVRYEVSEYAFHLRGLRDDYTSHKELYIKTRSQDPDKAKSMLEKLRELAEKAELEADFKKTIATAIMHESENRQRQEFQQMLKQLASSPQRLEDQAFMEKIEAYAGRFNDRQRLKEAIANVNFVNPFRKAAG